MDAHVAVEEPRKKPQVILVEDDAGVRRSLLLVLRARGFDVRAFSGPQLLLSDGADIDGAACLVADYRFDHDNGLDLLTALRLKPWSGPAILITAYHSAALEEEARRRGFAAVLAKPFHDRELADTVARLVDDEIGRC